jgi:predicted dehydrogenase
MNPSMHLAIAGAWGYIGRKFLEAAQTLNWQLSVYDPAPVPGDVRLDGIECIATEDEFLGLQPDLFHLALHPDARDLALQHLLARDGVAILNEKPMAAPQNPHDCAGLLAQLRASAATPAPILLFDFPEVFDPLTTRILDFLRQFKNIQVDSIAIERSKDREDPDNPRNKKMMVHIQYQETVHCFAFVLYLLGQLHGRPENVIDQGLRIRGEAEPYAPPNPQDYDTIVDGKTVFEWHLGATTISGWTDFKAGAPSTKLRTLSGVGDGRNWQIEVDYLEGAKRLSIDGIDQGVDARGSSYVGVLQTFVAWLSAARGDLMTSTAYPNARFAELTYQMSSLLWRSCYENREFSLDSTQDLLAFDADFATAQRTFERYDREGRG